MKRILILALLLATTALPAVAQSNLFVGYLGLGTGSNSFVEMSGGGYARQPITLAPPAGGVASNTVGATFGPATGAAWNTITERALFDSPTGGNLIAWWPITVQPSIAVGGTSTVQQGQIRLSLVSSGAPALQPAGAVIGTTSSNQAITAGTVLSVHAGTVAATGATASIAAASGTATAASLLGPVGHKVGLKGEGSIFSNAAVATWYNSRYQHISGPQGFSCPQLVYENLTGAATPERGLNAIVVQAEFEYPVGVVHDERWSASGAGILSLSVTVPPGSSVTGDPMCDVYVPPNTVYYTRTLVAGSGGNYFPASRNTQPYVNEFVQYGTATPPTSPMGADLVSSATSVATSTTLTFSSTVVSGFSGATIATPAAVQANCLAPNTVITATSATTLTIAPGVQATAGCASGTTFNIYANRAFNDVGGYPPANILGRTISAQSSFLIVGDSIGAGKFMQAALTTTAATSAGNVLTFASTTPAAGNFLYPGMELPAYATAGTIPAGTMITSFNATSVTLNNNVTVGSGVVVTFGQEGDALGQAGWVERCLGTSMPWANQAISGDRLYNLLAGQNGQFRAATYGQGFTSVIDEYNVNDFSSGSYPNLAAYEAAKTQFWTLLAAQGMRVYATTGTVETTSTDGWTTPGNQTASSANFAVGGLEQQYNDWVRTTPAPLTGYIDVANAQMTATDSQLWRTTPSGITAVPNAAGYPMTTDGTHPVGPGPYVLAQPCQALVTSGYLH